MNKSKYIEMLLQDNDTEPDAGKKKLYSDVIDCAEIGLSQTADTLDIDSSIGLPELWSVIEEAGQKQPTAGGRRTSVGPFEAAELIAAKLGTKYVRATRRKAATSVNLEDFLD